MQFYAQGTAQRGSQLQTPQASNLFGDSFEMNSLILTIACDPIHFSNESRYIIIVTHYSSTIQIHYVDSFFAVILLNLSFPKLYLCLPWNLVISHLSYSIHYPDIGLCGLPH